MKNEEFLRLCKAKVAEYTNSHMDKTDGKQITVKIVARKKADMKKEHLQRT